MPNPLQAAWDFLRGHDLQLQSIETPDEKKIYYWQDPGALVTPPTIITSGPGQWMLANPQQTTGDGNSAVWACLLALSNAHIEPPLRVYRGDPESGTAEWLQNAPLQALLLDPNPYHTNLELWFWSSWAKHADGNAYLRKVRSGDEVTGNVIELWPLSPTLVQPVTLAGSKQLIDFYRYTWAPGKWDDIPPENIIHFRIGIDDRDQRLGMSPLKRLVREIASDTAATQFSDALLRNFGVPGLVVQVPQGASLSDDQAESLKQKLETRFGFENRGNVGVLTAGATLQQFGFSPEQLNLKALHDVPETRIAAAMGVPPAVAGLGVGLEQTSNFASMKQVRENFTEVTVVPHWRMDAAKMNHQLKPDFTDEDDVRIAFDLTNVRALQEDRNELFGRVDNAVKTGWMTPNEARAAVGLEPMDGGDVPMPKPTFPAAPPPPTQALAAPVGGKERVISLKAGELTADALQALVELGTPELTAELQRYFDGQRRRVVRSLSKP